MPGDPTAPGAESGVLTLKVQGRTGFRKGGCGKCPVLRLNILWRNLLSRSVMMGWMSVQIWGMVECYDTNEMTFSEHNSLIVTPLSFQMKMNALISYSDSK